MKVAAARALADVISPDELRDTYIVPSPFTEGVVAEVVREQARRERVTAPTGESRT